MFCVSAKASSQKRKGAERKETAHTEREREVEREKGMRSSCKWCRHCTFFCGLAGLHGDGHEDGVSSPGPAMLAMLTMSFANLAQAVGLLTWYPLSELPCLPSFANTLVQVAFTKRSTQHAKLQHHQSKLTLIKQPEMTNNIRRLKSVSHSIPAYLHFSFLNSHSAHQFNRTADCQLTRRINN